MTYSKLYRSRDDVIFCGVLGGISELIRVDAVLLRTIVVVGTIQFNLTLPIVIGYLIATWLIPKEPIQYTEKKVNWRHFESTSYYNSTTRQPVEDAEEIDEERSDI